MVRSDANIKIYDDEIKCIDLVNILKEERKQGKMSTTKKGYKIYEVKIELWDRLNKIKLDHIMKSDSDTAFLAMEILREFG